MLVVDALRDLLLPRSCAACQMPGTALCAGCVVALDRLAIHRTATSVWAAHDAHGLGRAVVRAHKESSTAYLAPALGHVLARSVHDLLRVESVGPEFSISVVPVPQRLAARVHRRRDPTDEVARWAAQMLAESGLRVSVVKAATFARQPSDQRGLGLKERAINLEGAMQVQRRCVRSLWSSVVVAVDDVVTTGSTLTELRRCLTAAGIAPIGCAAAIATPRRGR